MLGLGWGADILWRDKDINLLLLALEVWVTPALSGLLPVHANSGVAPDSLEAFNRIAEIPSKPSSSDHSCPCHLKETSSCFPLTCCSAALLPQNSTVALNGSKNPFPQGPKLPHLCVWQPTERGQEPATSRFPPTLFYPAHLCQQGRGRNFAVNPIFCSGQAHSHSHHQPLLRFIGVHPA